LFIVLGWLGTALVAALAPPPVVDLAAALRPPGPGSPAGTDPLGRSLALLIAEGGGTALLIALPATWLAAVIGSALGVLAGLRGGLPDRLIVAATSVVLAVPGLLLALTLAALFGPRIENIIAAVALAGWPVFARLARSRSQALAGEAFVVAARAAGLPGLRIMTHHVAPALAGTLWVQAAFTAGGAVLAEGGLAFLGLGDPTRASLGALTAEGLRHIRTAPHLALLPALATTSLVLAFNLIGESLAARARGD
jgi:peptide/nickel transport system permease protein